MSISLYVEELCWEKIHIRHIFQTFCYRKKVVEKFKEFFAYLFPNLKKPGKYGFPSKDWESILYPLVPSCS